MGYMPYSYDLDDQQDPQGASRRLAKRLPIKQLVIVTIIVGVVVGGIYLFSIIFPDHMRSLLISVDRLGITEVGAAEQRRVRTINRLPITYEEKQVLISRTVFLGASREMVYLALGDPVCVWREEAKSKEPGIEYWVYYIENNRKPTQLAFQSNELTGAGMASALDVCK